MRLVKTKITKADLVIINQNRLKGYYMEIDFLDGECRIDTNSNSLKSILQGRGFS